MGVLNTAVDLAILSFMIWLFPAGRTGLSYSLFKAISFIGANINSYIFNKKWSFKGDAANKTVSTEFSQYFAVSLIGMLINVSVASFVVNQITPPTALEKLAGYWPQIGALCGTAVGLIWNFLGYKIFVFNKNKK